MNKRIECRVCDETFIPVLEPLNASGCICPVCRYDLTYESERVEANGKPYPHYDTYREQEE